jgi:hypothetical protein
MNVPRFNAWGTAIVWKRRRGPIHVVTLFGPETRALFAARSPNAIALWAGIACSPCVNAYNNRQSVCRNNLCMQAITVDDVFEKVAGMYDSLKRTTSGN